MAFLEVNNIPLRVIKESGVSTETGVKITETQMLKGSSSWSAPTFRVNSGNYGVTFTVNVLVQETDIFEGYSLKNILDNWEIHSDVLNVVTDAIDVPNSKYILTIGKKKQTEHYTSEWELTFHEWYGTGNYFTYVRRKNNSMSTIDWILLYASKPIYLDAPSKVVQALTLKLQQYGYCIIDPTIHSNYNPEYKGDSEAYITGKYYYVDVGDYNDIIWDVSQFNFDNGLIEEGKSGMATTRTIELLLRNNVNINNNNFYTRGIKV